MWPAWSSVLTGRNLPPPNRAAEFSGPPASTILTSPAGIAQPPPVTANCIPGKGQEHVTDPAGDAFGHRRSAAYVTFLGTRIAHRACAIPDPPSLNPDERDVFVSSLAVAAAASGLTLFSNGFVALGPRCAAPACSDHCGRRLVARRICGVVVAPRQRLRSWALSAGLVTRAGS